MKDIKTILSEMTLEEKASLLSGGDFWHTKAVARFDIPRFMVTDGPHGLRKQDEKADNLGINDSIEAVCFPSAAGLASSFDRDLIFRVGDTLGKECRAEDVSILLGPAVNIKRSPLCGRNFEYLSEDPYLAGELATKYILGVQQNDVGVSMKHYAVNNQEYRRMAISAEVDRRTLHEMYLMPFEKAVKNAKPWTLMCSYNQINGTYSSENPWLLTDILRERWGFDGFVMTDWGAIHDRAQGLLAGLELEMPSSGGMNDKKVVEAVKAGTLNETAIDLAVERLLTVFFRYLNSDKPKGTFNRAGDHKKAADTALSTMVLLKNDGILPLSQDRKITFLGEFAKKPRYQGGGSSHVNPHRVVSAWEMVKENKNFTFAAGYSTKSDCIEPELEAEAVHAAKLAEVAILFVGLPDRYESEGYDRTTLDLPEYQNHLIEAVLKVQKNVVIVLHNGSPVAMPWVDSVSAILESYLAGEGVGEAQTAILFGAANPSAKLAETFPIALSDTPCANFFPGGLKTVEYREGLYVGYRYYLSAKKPVLYPFGHGLSYTTFEYSDLQLSETAPFSVRFSVKNTGKYDGAEIAQLYIEAGEKATYRPLRELKGFEKIFLKAGEAATVTIPLSDESFRSYNAEADDWYIESGKYFVAVGASAEDIRLRGEIRLETTGTVPKEEKLPLYRAAEVQNIPDAEFTELLGRAPSPKERVKGTPFTGKDTLEEAKDTKWGKRILKLAPIFMRGNATVNAEMLFRGFSEMPMDGFTTISDGKVNEPMRDAILMLINDQGFFKFLRAMFRGWRATRKKD